MSSTAVSKEILQFVLDGVFPPACIGCSKAGEWLCGRCLGAIPLIGSVESSKESGPEALVAVSSYKDPIMGGLIRSFKYQRALCLEEEALRSVLFRFGSEVDFSSLLSCTPTMLVPLPMDPERERQRGLDHALRLARLIQQVLFPEVPVVQALTRTKIAKTNASLQTAEARSLNLQGVFACCQAVKGASILLIDDVYTTGATLNEATEVLRAAHAPHVQAFVLAQSGGQM